MMIRGVLSFLLVLVGGWAVAGDTLSLAGEWRFWLPGKEGTSGTVWLPGSMAENGKGDEVTVDTKWTASIYDSSWFLIRGWRSIGRKTILSCRSG
ncbi:hypothetical protein ACQ86N_35170 [Puia sp. P3]|uniref:hypothetical protein n=1 Tax=Puia sp. P3 TaxID=3423952 RepID=UPI003D672111